MKFILFFLVLFSIGSFSQNINLKKFDEKFNDSLLVGKCNIDAFKQAPYDEWFYQGFEEYTPSDSLINLLSNKLQNIEITIVLGVWCSDSRREFPHFIKILELIDYDFNNLNIIAVDTKKKANNIDISKLNIELIPTFIIYSNKNEIGRIIETPETTLENDIYNLIKN